MSKRVVTLIVGAVMAVGVPAPAALAAGDPIPHCEIWYEAPLVNWGDIIPVSEPRTPVLHCT
jgi:hypothetical protein